LGRSPTDASLVSSYIESLNLCSGRVYGKCAHEINVLFSLVWKIVAWELVTAYAVLEAGELNEKIGNVRENGENSKAGRNKKKKKKEAISMKGTRLIMDFIKEKLHGERKSDVENSRLLETWVDDFLSFLDSANPEFNDFLLKVNDVVQSNDNTELKIPKVIFAYPVHDSIFL